MVCPSANASGDIPVGMSCSALLLGVLTAGGRPSPVSLLGEVGCPHCWMLGFVLTAGEGSLVLVGSTSQSPVGLVGWHNQSPLKRPVVSTHGNGIWNSSTNGDEWYQLVDTKGHG